MRRGAGGLLFAYAGLHRAAISNVLIAPADTLRWHLLALPLAVVLLILTSRHFARAT